MSEGYVLLMTLRLHKMKTNFSQNLEVVNNNNGIEWSVSCSVTADQSYRLVTKPVVLELTSLIGASSPLSLFVAVGDIFSFPTFSRASK